jgi:hypothetical protein
VPAVQFDQNGYTGVVGSAPALLGKQAFIGNSAGHPGYITSSCVLTGAKAGDTLSVRFLAAYDYGASGNLTPPGWQVVSVQLSEGVTGAVQVGCPCGTLERKVGDIVTIAGSSMGALVGGLHAAGSLEPYTDWVTSLSQLDVLRLLDPSLSWPGTGSAIPGAITVLNVGPP